MRRIALVFSAAHAGCDFCDAILYASELISIPAVHAGCNLGGFFSLSQAMISIPAAHAGCDSLCSSHIRSSLYFNPRSPCELRLVSGICFFCRVVNFNPRSPCGLRPICSVLIGWDIEFQSPQPMRAATRHGSIQIINAL